MSLNETFTTLGAEETERLGAWLAAEFCKRTELPSFVALYGDLGVGKTAFVRGFASVITPGIPVRSPTFAIVNEYRASGRELFHFDMYRIDSEDDLLSIGFYDYWERGGICLVEWSEKIPYALPDTYLRVEIQKSNPEKEDERRITVTLVKEDI